MFTPEMIKSRVRQQPFMPFRIGTSGGQAYDVVHPDLIMVGRRDLMIGTASAKDPTTYETVVRIAIMHVAALEDLPAPPQTKGNGQE